LLFFGENLAEKRGTTDLVVSIDSGEKLIQV
jgi:hypothetical protein